MYSCHTAFIQDWRQKFLFLLLIKTYFIKKHQTRGQQKTTEIRKRRNVLGYQSRLTMTFESLINYPVKFNIASSKKILVQQVVLVA